MSLDTIERTSLVPATAQTANMQISRVASLQPQTFAELLQFGEVISKTSFIPKEFYGKPGDIVAAVAFGAELGLKAMQALQSICVINGKPSIWGDAMLALVRNAVDRSGRPLLEAFDEGIIRDEKGKCIGAWCESKRYGWLSTHTDFTEDDAKTAQLLNKAGTWQTYPTRMYKFRARAFNLRDNFGDVLKGLRCVEEVLDYPEDEPEERAPTRGVEGLRRRLQEKAAVPVKLTDAEALEAFAQHALECEFGAYDKKSLATLAQIICGKDKPTATDLQAACELGTPAWTAAILEARKRTEAVPETPTPEAKQADPAPATLPLDEPIDPMTGRPLDNTGDPFGEPVAPELLDQLRAACNSQRRDLSRLTESRLNCKPEEMSVEQAEALLVFLNQPVQTAKK